MNVNFHTILVIDRFNIEYGSPCIYFQKNKKSALPVEHLGNSDDRHQSHKNIILQLIFSLGRHKTLE